MTSSVKGFVARNRNEVFMLFLVSLQAFFIGAFNALFTVGSHVLFLQSFTTDKLPSAMIVSGVIGIVYLSVYVFFINRIRISIYAFINLLVIFLITAYISFSYDHLVHYQVYGILLMVPFTLVFPMTFVSLLIFRRSVQSIFHPGQNRRMAGFIQTSLMFGIIISSYILVGSLYIFKWDILLIIGAGSAAIGLAMILQVMINIFRNHSGSFIKESRHIKILRSRFYELFYMRYSVILILFVLLSAITGFILHFNFVAETRINYPNTIGLAKFFAFFMGTMMLFIFSIDKFLIRKILYSYDSPYSLVLIPVVLALATLATIIVDLIMGTSNAIARFSFGFLMVAMLRIGYETTNQAIEIPSLRVLFRTLDVRFSNVIVPRMEGSFRMIALVIAGLAVSALYLFHLYRSLFMNLLILLLTIIWIPVAIVLVKSYQKALREYIRKLRTTKRAFVQDLLNTDEKMHGLINSSDAVKAMHALSVVERLEPLTHDMHVNSLIETSSPDLKKYLLERIEENAMLNTLPKLKQLQAVNHNKQVTGIVTKLISRFEIKTSLGSSKDTLDQLVNSKNLADRILAAEIIGNSGNQELADLLLPLSRDIEPEVKFASVKAMARLSSPSHSYILIGYLSVPSYYPYAFESLVKIGDPAIPFLEQVFLLPDADVTLLSRIVRIYGKIGTPRAIDLLLAKIENQSRLISRQALLALRESKFQATPANLNRILNDIVRLINAISWNFSAYLNLGKSHEINLLREALESEINENYNTLYHLLALAYNSTSIVNIKSLLSDGSDQDISFAVEMLDQIVNEEIKQVFFPVVENLSVKDRVSQLQYFFQTEKENTENIIQDIIIRDYNLLSYYVKACAIFNIPKLRKPGVSQELVATVFHPNQLLRESAAYIIEQLQPAYLDTVYPRLDNLIVNELKASLSHANDGFPYLLLHRIHFLKQIPKLMAISEDILFEISKMFELGFLTMNDEFLVKYDDVHYALILIFDGKVQIMNSRDKIVTFGKKDIIYSNIFVEGDTYTLKALSDLRFYALDQELLNSLMFDYIDFRNVILDLIAEYKA